MLKGDATKSWPRNSPMSKYLYKYAGPGFIDKIFAKGDAVTLKCGYPAEFNDPYELFLTMDFKEDPGLIAFYADVVGKLPQQPTTCFSRSPSVIPMWAHYANNLQGFALEVDEEKLHQHFPESGFGDVDYQDVPSETVESHLYRAYEIGKFRYMHFLRQSVFAAAYFTKQLCWAYEMERRMVLVDAEVRKVDGMTLMDMPPGCINAIICGPRASEKTVNALRVHADAIGCRFYQMKIGRSSGIPFFFDSRNSPAIFSKGSLSAAESYCSSCKEPTDQTVELCSWCQIDDSHKQDAARRNSFRMLDRYGLLESYLEGVQKIDRGEK
jgi:hypothetical protein